jgi:hypothetical protein
MKANFDAMFETFNECGGCGGEWEARHNPLIADS